MSKIIQAISNYLTKHHIEHTYYIDEDRIRVKYETLRGTLIWQCQHTIVVDHISNLAQPDLQRTQIDYADPELFSKILKICK